MKPNNPPEFTALIGLDWGDKSHAIALQPADGSTETSTLEHSPESLHQWLDQLEQRFGARPVAIAIETDQGAVVYALLERPWITVLLSLLQHHRQRLRPLQLDDETTRTLARLVEARRKAVDRRTLLLNQLVSTLKNYFPQALELVGEDLCTDMALDFLAKWPRLIDVQAAKPATLKSFYHRHNVRRPQLIQKRLDRVRSARLLTRDPAVIEVSVRVVQLLVAELRVLVEHITAFESAIAQDFARHPEKAFFSELPGAGPTLAPRLLAAFGTIRELYPEVACMQRYFGVAPVTEKSGFRAWIHWRWNAPTFTRQTLVEWAGQTIVFCPWAKAFYERQRARGSAHHAIMRALAFKWLRVLWRCWQKRQPYNQEQFLRQLEKRRSPIAARARQLALEMAA